MGNTPSNLSLDDKLRDACYDGNYNNVVHLIEEGANVNAKGGGGWSTLHNAAMEGHVDICKYLLDHDCDVNMTADNGTTALHKAAYYGNDDVVELLIERGADLHALDRDEDTPVDEARSRNHISVLAILDVAIEEEFIKFFDGIKPQRAKELVKTIKENEEEIINVPALKTFFNEVKGDREDEHDALKELGITKAADRIVIIKALRKSIITEEVSICHSEHSHVSDLTTKTSLSTTTPKSNNPTPQKLNIPQKIDSEIEPLTLPPEYKYHAFLTHNWGTNDKNHKRVSIINQHLQKQGVITWFDDDRMQGNIANQMSRGINNSMTVICFITNDYITKVAGEGEKGDNDNCKLEFEYACECQGVKNLIVVEMEETDRPWKGSVGLYAGKLLSYSFKRDRDLKSCVEALMTEIEQRIDGDADEYTNYTPYQSRNDTHEELGTLKKFPNQSKKERLGDSTRTV